MCDAFKIWVHAFMRVHGRTPVQEEERKEGRAVLLEAQDQTKGYHLLWQTLKLKSGYGFSSGGMVTPQAADWCDRETNQPNS